MLLQIISKCPSLAWWDMPVILALRRLKQEDLQFQPAWTIQGGRKEDREGGREGKGEERGKER
jgi:hypothetical protein